MSIPLRDTRGSLVGWTDEKLQSVYTLDHQPSVVEKRPESFIAGYAITFPDGTVKAFGPSISSQVRPNKRHTKRLVALAALRKARG